MAIESFGMKLAVDVKMKKPFHAHCAECTYQSTDLTSWTFVPASTTLQKGMLHIVNLFSYSKLT